MKKHHKAKKHADQQKKLADEKFSKMIEQDNLSIEQKQHAEEEEAAFITALNIHSKSVGSIAFTNDSEVSQHVSQVDVIWVCDSSKLSSHHLTAYSNMLSKKGVVYFPLQYLSN